MNLRGREYGPVHVASGTMGFYGPDEYKRQRFFGTPDFTGATKVAKTVTLERRDTTNGANMELDGALRPVERFPRCIAVNPVSCCSVNAVGLANEGLQAHLDRGVWQTWQEPFFLSLMAVGATSEERMEEWHRMFTVLAKYRQQFKGLFAIQQNHSCPNAGHDPRTLISDTMQVLSMAAEMLLGVPQVPKFNVEQLSVASALEIGDHENCDGILLSNTVPWQDLPLSVRLRSFGTPFSPLRWRGIKQPGGYAGPYLLPLVEERIRELRSAGFTKPIIACGGITKVSHVDWLFAAGADAIEFATVAIVRPRRVQSIIQRAKELGRK